VDHQTLAERILTARRDGATIPPLTEAHPLTLDDAYAVQALVIRARALRGERLVGWKVGRPNAAGQGLPGGNQRNFGPLTDAMARRDGDPVGPGLIQPRVQPTIAVRLGRALPGAPPAEDVPAAVTETLVCLEIVDSVFDGYRSRLEDDTADGSSAAGFVLGPPLSAGADLDKLAVVMLRNGERVTEAATSDMAGHPYDAVSWLAAELGRRGRSLGAGDLVITGALTPAIPLEPGDRIEGVFAGWIHVAVWRRPED
jgi:2-keto-4-pentenoate hydratase